MINYWFKQSKQWYIYSPINDLIFIVLTPLFAFFAVILFCGVREENYLFSSKTPLLFGIFCSVLTHAHILIGFSRSHFNRDVFNRYKHRFTIIPLLTLLAMWFISPVFIFLGTLAIYWDEWHSLMQVFGFGRIYDGKQNKDVFIGRKLDMYMSFLVSFFPNVILLTYFAERGIKKDLTSLLDIDLEDVDFYANALVHLRWPLIIFSVIFFLYYVYFYINKSKSGYIFSWPKLIHFVILFLTTLYVALNYTIFDTVFFGNIYHSISYFFIVYISEKKNFDNILNINPKAMNNLNQNTPVSFFTKYRSFILFFILLVPVTIFFATLRHFTEKMAFFGAFWILTSLLHFWFDGFIWSVRRKDI